jgi:hypothetical protein
MHQFEVMINPDTIETVEGQGMSVENGILRLHRDGLIVAMYNVWTSWKKIAPEQAKK